MNLPKPIRPVFTLPAKSGEVSLPTIKYQPFTVKEEKILLIAEQQNSKMEIADAVKQILKNCIYEGPKPEELSSFVFDYLFIQLRAKSIGNEIEFKIKDSEDGKIHELKLDLDEVQIHGTQSNLIVLSEDFVLEMKYPTVDQIESLLDFDREDPDQVIKMVARCMSKLYHGDDLYDLSQASEEELSEYLEDLGSAAFAKIQEFFSSIPVVRHELKYTNSLGHERSYVLEGLQDFFT